MPTVTVDIDVEDVLDQLDDSDLEMELARRRKERGVSKAAEPDPWTYLGIAEDLRTAFYACNATRFEDLLRVLDPRGPDRRPDLGAHRGDAPVTPHRFIAGGRGWRWPPHGSVAVTEDGEDTIVLPCAVREPALVEAFVAGFLDGHEKGRRTGATEGAAKARSEIRGALGIPPSVGG